MANIPTRSAGIAWPIRWSGSPLPWRVSRGAPWLVGLVFALGCSSAPDGGGAETAQSSLVGLTPAASCADVEAELRAQALREMRRTLEQNRQVMLSQGGWFCPELVFNAPSGVDGAPTSAPPTDSSGGARDYSTTNNQVVGVDEADFIKNDAEYIYVLAQGQLNILDAWPAEQTQRIAAVPIEGEPKRLFVHEDVAVVYASGASVETAEPDSPWGYSAPDGSDECTYGYDCDFRGDGRALSVQVFDIRDRRDPRLIRETEFNGSYLNSRRVGAVVHTALTFPEVTVEGVQHWPGEVLGSSACSEHDLSDEQIERLFDELAERNAELIASATLRDFLPSVTDTRFIDGEAVTEQGLLADCDGFYLSGSGDGRSLLSLLSFEMTELGPIAATTIVGRPGAVYASADALYVANRHQSSNMSAWFFDEAAREPEATTVHKFSLQAGRIETEYAGSGVVKGRVLNQFAMDEHEGHVRIATTTGHLPDPETHSTLSVLAEQEGELAVVGQIDDIAPTEDIRSVRFNGDVGFMVTFKKTDPLFVFDLADPRAPVIRGELKIPGYSTYMHLMDERHLLTIGYDADDQGDFAWFQGIQLQIMDVSNLDDPRLVHKEVIGTRGSTSEAATNHLAFNYFPSRDLLALPMTVCEGGSGGDYGYEMTFSGLLVYRATADEGFMKLGGVSHRAPTSGDDYASACGSWWTDSNSVVQRSVFMEDYVYSVALDAIIVAPVADLATPIATVDLAAP